MRQRQLTAVTQKRNMIHKGIVNIELEILCRCSLPTSNDDASIQFTRRYLQCQSATPIRIIRLLIGKILVAAPTVEISIFDVNDRLLKDTDRLSSLNSFSNCISLRFMLTNTITGIPHCPCLSACTESNSSSSAVIIQPANIDSILSTCDITQQQSSRLLTSTSEFEEWESLCLPLRKNKRFRVLEEMIHYYPLDLSMKKASIYADPVE